MTDYSVIDFENQILGLLLVTRGAINEATILLPTPVPFSGPDEKRVYAAFLALHAQGYDTDVISTSHFLTKAHGAKDSAGSPWMMRLTGYVAAAKQNAGMGISYKCQVLWQEWMRGEAARLASALLTESTQRHTDPFKLVNEALTGLNGLLNQLSTLSDVPFSQVLREKAAAARLAYETGEIPGVKTGLRDLDAMVKALQPQTLTILAARPAMGKTGQAWQILHNVVTHQGKGVAFFSLEMSSSQIAGRSLATETGIKNAQITAGMNAYNEPIDFARLDAAAEVIGQRPIYVYENMNTMPQIRAKCMELVSNKKVELIIIDYLQLVMTDSHEDREVYSRVTSVSRQLKLLSKQLNLPVLALSQLSRKVEERADKRPQMSDLKESGAIEQDADTIIFLYRPGYYAAKDKDGYPVDERLLLNIVAKNRNGSTHNEEEAVSLHYDLATNQITNWTTTPTTANF